jgi:hypothetical protein
MKKPTKVEIITGNPIAAQTMFNGFSENMAEDEEIVSVEEKVVVVGKQMKIIMFVYYIS